MTEDSYYAEVESHFVERRGSPLFITPNEWHLVFEWEQMGVPLPVVKEAIDRVFERPKTRLRPRKLGYCRQTVLAVFRRSREAGIGAGRERPSSNEEAESLAARLAEIASALRRIADSPPFSTEAFPATLRDLAERVLGLGPTLQQGELEHVESSLADLDAALVRAAEDVAPGAIREELRRESESSLASYRERMPEKVYQAALESGYRRRIRGKLGLPVLSLYS